MATTVADPLANSLSSLSSSTSHPPSISRSYKQASQLFLTRQLAEAWEVLQPLVTAGSTSSIDGVVEQSNGSAPVVSASKSARVKVWSLWIAVIHEILQLGAEEGGRALEGLESLDGETGSRRWRSLAKKVKDGDIWADVVNIGYAGIEAAVDAEVVANLATLLLSHAATQRTTQSRLDSYLSASSSIASPDALTTQLEQAQNGASTSPFTSPSKHGLANGHSHGHSNAQNGTSTPRDLGTRLKLLEIYALHVLPRNDEWDYARDFLNMSEVLDDERREAFLAALGSLKEESDLQSRREVELQRQRDEEEQRRQKAEQDKARREEERRNQSHADASAAFGSSVNPTRANVPATGSTSLSRSRPQGPGPSKSSIKKTSSNAQPKRNTNAPPPTLLRRASLTIVALQRALLQMGQGLSRNPMALLRMLLFMVALILAMARSDVRDRLKKGWEKVKGTMGMGVKVSYL